MYEGTPDFPHKDRWWSIVERYLRDDSVHGADGDPAYMKWGRSSWSGTTWAGCGCSGTVGEPINPEAWTWYRADIGGDRCPIVDTWWQTETGMIADHAAAGGDDAEAGLGDFAVPGRRRGDLRRAAGNEVPRGGGGYLVLRRPWPAMLRGDLGRRRALPRDLLVAVPGRVLRR